MKPIELDTLELGKILNHKQPEHLVLRNPKLGAFMTIEEYERKWGIIHVEDTTDEVNRKTTG
jgi:hypothetical protein